MLCKQRKSENIFVIFDIELQTDVRVRLTKETDRRNSCAVSKKNGIIYYLIPIFVIPHSFIWKTELWSQSIHKFAIKDSILMCSISCDEVLVPKNYVWQKIFQK